MFSLLVIIVMLWCLCRWCVSVMVVELELMMMLLFGLISCVVCMLMLFFSGRLSVFFLWMFCFCGGVCISVVLLCVCVVNFCDLMWVRLVWMVIVDMLKWFISLLICMLLWLISNCRICWWCWCVFCMGVVLFGKES